MPDNELMRLADHTARVVTMGLSYKPGAEDRRRYLEVARTSATNMLALLDEVLELESELA